MVSLAWVEHRKPRFYVVDSALDIVLPYESRLAGGFSLYRNRGLPRLLLVSVLFGGRTATVTRLGWDE